jgi:hypothetical protein
MKVFWGFIFIHTAARQSSHTHYQALPNQKFLNDPKKAMDYFFEVYYLLKILRVTVSQYNSGR